MSEHGCLAKAEVSASMCAFVPSDRPRGNVLAVRGMDWIETIGSRPIGESPLAASLRKAPQYGPPSVVAHIELDLRPWDGPLGSRRDHFGKGAGQVRSRDGTPPLRSCQEVEVVKSLRTVRDHAYWFSGFGGVPEPWQPWASSLRAAPDWLAALDKAIRSLITSRRGGMPDVVAWNDHDPVASAIFIECKAPGETFLEAQEDWAWAALRVGVRSDQIAVSLRTAATSAAKSARTGHERVQRAPRASETPDIAALVATVTANLHIKPEGLKRVERGLYELEHDGKTYTITRTGPSTWVTTLDGKPVGTIQPSRYESYLQVRALTSDT